jgi:acetyltransferase-like isoleucine patch superfamily enzyme
LHLRPTDKITIHNNPSISANSTFIAHIGTGESPLRDIYERSSGPIAVKELTWVGTGSTIFHSVSIGPKLMIGGMSPVNKTIEVSKLAFGNPVK